MLWRGSRERTEGPAVAAVVRDAFDHAFYRSQLPDLGQASDAALLAHYVGGGWRDGHDPAPWFSVQGYLAFHEDVRTEGMEPFLHFLAHGRAENRIAPPARGSEERGLRWFSDQFGRFIGEFPRGFDPQLYALAADLAPTNRWVALAHFILRGAFQPIVLGTLQPGPELLEAAGDCHFHGDTKKALHCYALADARRSDDASLKRKLGDCYARLDLTGCARSAYLAAVAAGDTTSATAAALGRASLGLGQFDEAVEYLGRASEGRGVDYALLNLRRQAAFGRFRAALTRSRAQSRDETGSAARQLAQSAIADLRSLLSDVEPPPLVRASTRPVSRMLVVGEEGPPPASLLRDLAQGDLTSDFVPAAELASRTSLLLAYDGLIVDHARLTPELMDVLLLARRFGLTTCYVGDEPPADGDNNSLEPAEARAPATPDEQAIDDVLRREAMALCDVELSAAEARKAMATMVGSEPSSADTSAIGEGRARQSVSEARPPAVRTILVVNIFYPPEDVGGATRVVEQTLAHALVTGGGTLSFEVLCGREYDGRAGSVERYECAAIPVTTLSPFTDLDQTENSEATEAFFADYVDRVRPDLIHFHCIQRLGVSMLDVARRKDIPYLVTAHDGWWISDQQFLVDGNGVPVADSGEWGNADRLLALREALNRGVATVTVSHSQARLYQARGIANVRTIANGSAAIEAVPAPPRDGPVRLGLLGGLGMPKGGELVREVLRHQHYRNLQCVVVDHALPEDMVRQELWGENRVEVRGRTGFDSVGKIYGELHGVLAVSVCVESFGLVAREAKRLGRWVVASNRGGIGEDVVNGVDGFIVDPADPRELAGVLDLMNAAPERFRTPPPHGGEVRDVADAAADYLALYRSILGEAERSPE